MDVTENAKRYREKMFPESESSLQNTDPEFVERLDNFALDEVVNSDDLDDKTRFTAILASLLGCGGIDAYKTLLPAAMNFGVTATEVKEIVYQATAYLGIGRTYPFLMATNEALREKGIALPLPPQTKTTTENRREYGEQAQIDIFGEHMRGFAESGEADVRHINKWLTENCFGDYYTRGGLDYRQRELITFCFLSAQGGCEPQLIAHAKANIRLGNDKAFLIKVISQCLPYLGYPRSLNALTCVETADKELRK